MVLPLQSALHWSVQSKGRLQVAVPAHADAGRSTDHNRLKHERCDRAWLCLPRCSRPPGLSVTAPPACSMAVADGSWPASPSSHACQRSASRCAVPLSSSAAWLPSWRRQRRPLTAVQHAAECYSHSLDLLLLLAAARLVCQRRGLERGCRTLAAGQGRLEQASWVLGVVYHKGLHCLVLCQPKPARQDRARRGQRGNEAEEAPMPGGHHLRQGCPSCTSTGLAQPWLVQRTWHHNP